MDGKDVIELYKKLEEKGIDMWLDGGWGVDALLGKKTRPHEDVDIVIQQKYVPILRKLLEAQGYQDVERDDTSAWNFVLGDSKGRSVDVHAFTFDAEGNGIYGPNGLTYPAESLKGNGKVNGNTVKCISAQQIVKFHTGYKPDENDIKDMTALCKRFKIELPKEYREKLKRKS